MFFGIIRITQAHNLHFKIMFFGIIRINGTATREKKSVQIKNIIKTLVQSLWLPSRCMLKKYLGIIYSCCVGSVFNLDLNMETIQLARFTCCYVDMCCAKMT